MHFHKLGHTSAPSGLSYNSVCCWRQFSVRVSVVVVIKDVLSVTGLFKSQEFSNLCILLLLNEML